MKIKSTSALLAIFLVGGISGPSTAGIAPKVLRSEDWVLQVGARHLPYKLHLDLLQPPVISEYEDIRGYLVNNNGARFNLSPCNEKTTGGSTGLKIWIPGLFSNFFMSQYPDAAIGVECSYSGAYEMGSALNITGYILRENESVWIFSTRSNPKQTVNGRVYNVRTKMAQADFTGYRTR